MNRYSTFCFMLAFCILFGCRHHKAIEQSRPFDDGKYAGSAFKDNIRPTEAMTAEEERLGFKLPDGFEISLYASEPEIGKPINIAFDSKGRMWVTQSFEYPFAAAGGTGKDRLTILADTDNDGKADKFTRFIDTLNIPIGLLPMSDGAVAYSIPNVYKFTDANGDGKPESHKKFLGPFEYKDTHGMVNNFVRGYDGWVHACHGYSNRSMVAGADGDSIRMISGNTFRFRPDGSHVEKTTDGRINPFGLAYDEKGYLYSTDCHTSPLYQLIRGGDYTQWGKEETMGFAPEMKPFDNEATALAGIAYYGDKHFPEAYQQNFYIGDPVSSRVYRNSFSFKGATPVGKKEPDFILSQDPWFRPVDIKMGPDGALYVADFYNSIIGHYEVPLNHPKRDRIRGRIWRITYKGKTNKPKNWASATVKELLSALNADNLPTRMFAADELADRIGLPAVPSLRAIVNNKRTNARKMIHALWVLQRLNALDKDVIRKSAVHKDPLVRMHTMRILLEQKDDSRMHYNLVTDALRDKDPHVQRAAMELLIHYPDINTIKAALAMRQAIPEYDSHFIYTTRLILRNLLRKQTLMNQVNNLQWSAQDAAWLADVMVDVPSAASASFLAGYLKAHTIADKKLPITFQHLARFIPTEEMNDVFTIGRKQKGNLQNEYQVFKAIQRGIAQKGGKDNGLMADWGRELAHALLIKLPLENPSMLKGDLRKQMIEQQTFAIDQIGNYKIRALQAGLISFVEKNSLTTTSSAEEGKESLNLKTAALRSLMKIDPDAYAPLAAKILQDQTMPVDFRKQVAMVLGEFPDPVINHVLSNVKGAPQELQTAIVMSLANTSEGKDIIFQQVRNGNLLSRTLLDAKAEERILLGITPRQKRMYEELIANLEPVSKEKETLILNRLQAFRSSRLTSASDSGRITFMQNCSSCHKIGNTGGMIGPNLDGVNKWGAQALAEKILDPNRNIAENFRTYTVKTKAGKIMTGLFRREAGEVMVFADIAGQEFTIAKKDIEERKASKYTLMPDHFGHILTQTDFDALLNYLLNLKS